jgi:DNA mismatch repair MutL-like protein
VLTVEQPRHEQVPKPTQLAVGFDLHHSGAKGQPPSAGGSHAHHELLLDFWSPIHSTYERVPLGISGEVGEHLPDTLGGSFYLDLGTQLLHGDLLRHLLCLCTSFTAELRMAARGSCGSRSVKVAHPWSSRGARGTRWRESLLATARPEANAVANVVQSLALSRPGVGFYLRSDGRRVVALPAAADLRERISQVHGLPLARSLIALEDPVVWGFVSPLSLSFPTRRYVHVAVNGRVVDADSFAPAIAKAYADLLPKGRHPAATLRLELGPGEVDVNVHPAKSAVRLRGGRSAYPLVVGTIRSALSPERTQGGVAPQEGQEVELTLIGQFAGRCLITQL